MTPHNQREGSAGATSQECIEIRKLATLPFMPHPDILLRIPQARAMQQEKEILFTRHIFFVESFHPSPGELQ